MFVCGFVCRLLACKFVFVFGLSVEGLFLHGFDSEQVCFCVGLFCPIFLLISPPFLYNIFGLGAVCWPIFSFIMAINREEIF